MPTKVPPYPHLKAETVHTYEFKLTNNVTN